MVPTHVEGVEIGMEALAELDEVAPRLEPLVTAYGDWLKAGAEETDSGSGLSDRRREVARHLLDRAEVARGRMAEGIAALSDPVVLEAFQVTNRAMARAARQLHPERYEEGRAPSWRLFQLAFLQAMDLRDDGPPHGGPDRAARSSRSTRSSWWTRGARWRRPIRRISGSAASTGAATFRRGSGDAFPS